MGPINSYGIPSGEGEGQGSPPPSDDNVPEGQGSQPEKQGQKENENYITRDELRSALDDHFRKTQSLTDKMESRVDKELATALEGVQQAIDLAEKAGVPLTEEQKRDMRNEARDEALLRSAQRNKEPASQPPSGTNQGSNQQTANQKPAAQEPDFVTRECLRIMDETGVFISPEKAAKTILGENYENKMSEYEYVQAFEELARGIANQRQPQGPSPGIPSRVATGRTPPAKMALRQQYDKEVQQIMNGTHPTIKKGETMAIMRMKSAYKKKGLDI